MNEVRFHGRGGQGVVTTSKILANAFARTGQFGASFPMFGFERRGAPVTAFGRFNDKPIKEKTQIYNPNIVVVLDPSQQESPVVFEGIAEGGIVLINTDKEPDFLSKNIKKIGWLNASNIAIEEIGLPIPNTCITGAFAALSNLLDVQPVCEALEDYFSGAKLEANIRCVKRGFEQVKIIQK